MAGSSPLQKLLAKGEDVGRELDRDKLRAALEQAGGGASALVLAHEANLWPHTRVWLAEQLRLGDAESARVIANALGSWGAHRALDDAIRILTRLPRGIALPALTAARDAASAEERPTSFLDDAIERLGVRRGGRSPGPKEPRRNTTRAPRRAPTLEALLTREENQHGDPDRKLLAAAITAAGRKAGRLVVEHASQVSPETRVWMLGRVAVSDEDAVKVLAEALGWHTGADAAFETALPMLLALPAAIVVPALGAADQAARSARRRPEWIGRAMERVLVQAGSRAKSLVDALPSRQRKYGLRILEALAEESAGHRLAKKPSRRRRARPRSG